MADDQVEIRAAMGGLAIEGGEEEGARGGGGGERVIPEPGGDRVQAGGQEEARAELQLADGPHRRAPSGPSGTIRWEINKEAFSEFHFYKHSPMIEVGGMPWRMVVRAVGGAHPVAHINCHLLSVDGDYRVHSVGVTSEFKLINHDNDANTITKLWGGTIEHDSRAMKVWDCEQWNAFLRDGQGFVKDGKITMQVDFWLSNIEGFRRLSPQLDFTDPNEPSHDIAFLIDDGRKVFAGKQLLSIYSPVFNAMFYGGFVERNREEIQLRDVDYEEFVELLKVIYPPSKKITDKNFKYLLKLGLRFDMIGVMDKVEQFLLKGDEEEDDDEEEEEEDASEGKLGEVEGLLLADRYNLHKLKNHCLDQLSEVAREQIKESPEFDHLSQFLKDFLIRG